MKIAIKFPTRNRPEKFKEVFARYQDFLSGNHDVNFFVSMDNDDEKMNNDDIRSFLNNYPNTKYFYGDSKSKIEAINCNLDSIENFDVLMLASDDMIPNEPGYDDVVAKEMQNNFPDTDGVLAFRDGRRNDSLITFTIVGKKYFDRFGYLYHPSYTSVFCDNEFTEVANALQKVKYFEKVLFVHGWINYVGYDELMQRNESRDLYNKDYHVYAERRSKKFDLEI